MDNQKEFTKEDWGEVEAILSKVIDEDAWEMCSRTFLDQIEASLDRGENLQINTTAGGDHFPVPLAIQAIPFALSAVKEMVIYYKVHKHFPSTAKEFLELVPTNHEETKKFIMDNFPTIVGLILFGIQII